MWPINPDRDNSRGGFQNSDVGKTSFDDNYGPEYGIDYARFSDPPDILKDLKLKELIEKQLALFDLYLNRELIVRNGFVILKGSTQNEYLRNQISDFVKNVSGVEEVINQIIIEPI